MKDKSMIDNPMYCSSASTNRKKTIGRALRGIKKGELIEICIGAYGFWFSDAIEFFPPYGVGKKEKE